MDKITYDVANNIVATRGLKSLNTSEIQVVVNDDTLIDEGKHLLDYLAQYIVNSKKSVKANETISYGCWILKFIPVTEDLLEVWELATIDQKFARGASLALRLWRDQNQVCKNKLTNFDPPPINMLAAISEGVLDGDPVEGVRYEVAGQMSGWYVTTNKYNNDTKTLKIEHIYHLILQRPDLAKYLALPSGFRFDLRGKEDIRFDQSVAKESGTL